MHETNSTFRLEQKNKDLLYIKLPFLRDNPSRSSIKLYLKVLNKIVEQDLSNINKDGFWVIQTRDVRINRYIEPLAKRIIDMLTLDTLWLKEVIIVTQDGKNSVKENIRNYIKIVHQYLLVYGVKN